MSLQDDWLEYIRKPNSYSYDHFAPLITDTDEPLDLETAFGALPNGHELVRRINRVRNETSFTGLYYVENKKGYLPKNLMHPLAERYADSVANLLDEIGESSIAKQARFNPIEFVSESKVVSDFDANTLGLNEALDFVGDEFVDAKPKSMTFLRGLSEAVLFMTKVPEVTRYILGAMVEFPVDDEAAYELWKGGARVDFGDEKTYIILSDDYEEPKIA